jgi:NAD(P)-dependent dehydrogenase (short-subunit alcohol dehydrogenase family)
MQIKDKVAIVTGGASGIGRAAIEELVNRGVKAVGLVDVSDNVPQVTEEINKQAGSSIVQAFQGDVTDSEFRTKVFDSLCDQYDVVHICVPSAGIFRDRLAIKIDKETGEPDVYPIDLFHKVLEVNLVHPIYWSMELVARMGKYRHKQGLKKWHPDETVQGTIVFIGSVASQGNKGQISYATTKAGLEGAATTLMKESMFHGVRTAVIHPGFVDTPILQGMPEGYVEKYVLPDVQLGRLIRPAEIADAICFLISNSAVSGELWADAGWHPPVG